MGQSRKLLRSSGPPWVRIPRLPPPEVVHRCQAPMHDLFRFPRGGERVSGGRGRRRAATRPRSRPRARSGRRRDGSTGRRRGAGTRCRPLPPSDRWPRTRAGRAGRSRSAPAHIAHGSSVTYIVHSSSRHWPRWPAASRNASTSACATGSLACSRSLCRAAITTPSWTTTAPTGTSWWASAARASSSARAIVSTSARSNGSSDAGADMAEGVGFEPTEGCPSHAFQACRFGRSRIPPGNPIVESALG